MLVSFNQSSSLTYNNITLNYVSFEVCRGDKKIKLTMGCFRLLNFLMLRPGQVFTRQELRTAIKGEQTKDAKAVRRVDEHVYRLRCALGKPAIIYTVVGVGYAFGTNNIASSQPERPLSETQHSQSMCDPS